MKITCAVFPHKISKEVSHHYLKNIFREYSKVRFLSNVKKAKKRLPANCVRDKEISIYLFHTFTCCAIYILRPQTYLGIWRVVIVYFCGSQ